MNPLDNRVAVALTDYVGAFGTVIGHSPRRLGHLADTPAANQGDQGSRTERRTVFELEILRDLLAAVGAADF